jgi:hypothetical protein
MSGRLAARLRVLAPAVMAMFVVASPGAGAAPPEDPAALTGVDTPESIALDKEVEKIVEDRAKLIAQVKDRDAKKLQTSDLLQQASSLVRQAYDKAQAAADARAKGAVEQRCIKPSEEPAGTSDGSVASSFLCEAARRAAGPGGENDPWTVCSCARRYLLGLRKEIDELRSRRDSYVGKAISDDNIVSKHPLTAEEVNNLFRMRETIEADPGFGDDSHFTLEALSRQAQRQLSRDRTDALLRGQLPKPRILQELLGRDGLDRPKHQAYAYMLGSLTLLWAVHREETLLRTRILQQAVDERSEAESESSFSEQKKNWEAHAPSGDDAETIAIARRYDAREFPFILSTAQALRPIVATTRETRLRLKADAEAWNRFAARDGAGGGANWRDDFALFVEGDLMTPWSLMVGLPPWRVDWSRGEAANRQYAYLLPGHDSSDNYAGLIKDLKLQLPEIQLDPATPSLFLEHPINSKEKELTEAVASGAGSTEQP